MQSGDYRDFTRGWGDPAAIAVEGAVGTLIKTVDYALSRKLAKEAAADQYKYQTKLNEQQLANQQLLNAEDYRRKIDFYNNYESYEAQMAQMARAGLNPAMMFQGGASVNASGGVGTGSANAGSVSENPSAIGSLGSILSTLLGYRMDRATLKQQREIADEQNRIRDYDAQTRRLEQENYAALLAEQTEGQRIKNQWLPTLFGMQVGNASSLDDLRAAQIKVAEDALKNNEVQRRLSEAGIKESEARTRLLDAQEALTIVDKKLRETESKYYGEFLSLRNDLMGLSKELGETNNGFVKRTLEDRIKIVSESLAKLTAEANITEWQDKTKGTKMTLDYLTQVFKTLGIVGAALGGSAIRAGSKAFVPFYMPYSDPFRNPYGSGVDYDPRTGLPGM